MMLIILLVAAIEEFFYSRCSPISTIRGVPRTQAALASSPRARGLQSMAGARQAILASD